jgi:hypothetical protein
MIVFDTSGSMNACTTPPTVFPATCPAQSSTSPDNSCGQRPTRISDGRCALSKLVQSFGQVDFGLTSFTQTISGCGATPYSCNPYIVDGVMPEQANGCAVSAACISGTGINAHGGSVRVGLPVTADSLSQLMLWTDFDCGAGNELLPGGPTPLNGALRDAATHLRANGGALLPGSKTVAVIFITGGGESWDGSATENRAADAANDLYINGLNDGSGRHVLVYPVGFGGVTSAELVALNGVAKMGRCGSISGTCADAVSASIASNEAQLLQQLSTIVSSFLP